MTKKAKVEEAEQPELIKPKEVKMLTFRKKGKADVVIAANRSGTINILKGGGYKQAKGK